MIHHAPATKETQSAVKLGVSADHIPRHIGIIMDGNGRWAKRRGLPRLAGHSAGTEKIKEIVQAASDFGVEALTLYAFSTENWGRPSTEVSGLMRLVAETLNRELENMKQQGVKFQHSGSLAEIEPDLAQLIRHGVEETKENDTIVLNIAFNYGGRAEIVKAVREIVAAGIPAERVTEALIDQHLYTAGLPDPDLIIRTAGEFRLSNFLIWQAAYAEFYSTPVFWPDFTPEHLAEAIRAYAKRERKFGMLK